MPAAARDAAGLEFDAEFLRRLEVLNVVARKILSGIMRADRQSIRKGVSAEFADHRPYSPGDDIRHVDWHLFGRLEELFLKLYREEENLHLTVLLDVSASMRHGDGGADGMNKLTYGLQLAAALGYIGLSNMDCCNVLPFDDRLREGRWRLKGRGRIHGVFDFLRELHGQPHTGRTDLAKALKEFVSRERRRGVVVVISDFFDVDGFQQALRGLRHRKHDAYAIQLVDETERRPPHRGDLRLVDAETGGFREINVTDTLRTQYAEAFEALLMRVERFCVQSEMGYCRAPTTIPFDELVLTILRRGGLVG